jgi:hypothetical protein
MHPKTKEPQKQMEMFKRELEELVNPEHALVKLGRLIDWTVFEEKLGVKYHASIGAPGVNTRLMVALQYLISSILSKNNPVLLFDRCCRVRIPAVGSAHEKSGPSWAAFVE